MHTRPTPSDDQTRAFVLETNGAAASRMGTRCFDDVEEQAQVLTGWSQEYLQLSPGPFQGHIYQVEGSGIRLFVERVEQSVFQTGVLDSDVLAVGLPLDASGTGMFCGQACAADAFHVFSGASGFEFRTSRKHTMLGVELRLGQGALETLSANLGGGGHAVLGKRAGVLQMRPQSMAQLKAYFLALLQSARADAGLLDNPAVVATVTDFLLDHMVEEGAGDTASPDDASSHWALVRQACAMVHDHLDQVPAVATLCQQLAVSRRTLQYSFARVLGVNPLAYLKAVRLRQARRALKESKSVTDAATSNGFWHFGHFSQGYHAMYGELPSTTLRRYRCGS